MSTILIPAHNEAAVVDLCLETLLRDADKGEFEIFVLSNGSTDETVSVAQDSANRLNATDSVTVVGTPEAGKAAAINYGFDVGVGPDFIVLDADVLLEATAARQLFDVLQKPGVLAASTAVGFDFEGIPPISRSYHRFWSQLPSCLLYTSPSPRDRTRSRMPSSA